MSKEHIKLVTWPKIILMIIACFVGAAYGIGREYYETGNIESSQIVISTMTFFVGLTIIFFLVRHANKPEE